MTKNLCGGLKKNFNRLSTPSTTLHTLATFSTDLCEISTKILRAYLWLLKKKSKTLSKNIWRFQLLCLYLHRT